MLKIKLEDLPNTSNATKILMAVLILIATFVLSFGLTALFTWVACWCFSWLWTWKVALGIWCCMILVRMIFVGLADE